MTRTDTTTDRRTARRERGGPPTGRRTFLHLAACAGATVAASGTGAANKEEPTITVDVEDDTIATGERTTADVVLSAVPNGFVGYTIEVEVDPDVARIVGVELDDWAGVFEEAIEVDDDGGWTDLGASDLNGSVEAGDTDVLLGILELEGRADGETAVDVVADAIEEPSGEDAVQHLDAAVEPATLTVGDGGEGSDSNNDADDGGDESGDGGDTGDGLPGFGVGAALAGIAGGIGYAVRKGPRRERNGD